MFISTTSSANKLILWVLTWVVMPEMCGLEQIHSAKGSITKEKMKSDKGQPCLVPFEILMALERKTAFNILLTVRSRGT